jgi:hypothetical protein
MSIPVAHELVQKIKDAEIKATSYIDLNVDKFLEIFEEHIKKLVKDPNKFSDHGSFMTHIADYTDNYKLFMQKLELKLVPLGYSLERSGEGKYTTLIVRWDHFDYSKKRHVKGMSGDGLDDIPSFK